MTSSRLAKSAIVKLGLIGFTAGVLFTHASRVAAASFQCVPKSNTARVLKSPNPNDLHPQWRGQSYIGTSWTFVREAVVGSYFRGKLISPRGGVQPYRIFILPDEWDCGAH